MEHNFKKLGIWIRSKDLVVEIYKLSQHFPKSEQFGLTSQMRRCAVSVPSNISEGCGRGTPKQFKHFINISIGSICELETQMYIAHELGYCGKEILDKVTDEIMEVRKMMIGFQRKL